MSMTNRQRIIARLDAFPVGTTFTINDLQQEFRTSPAAPSHRLIYQVLMEYPRAEIIQEAQRNHRMVWGIVDKGVSA